MWLFLPFGFYSIVDKVPTQTKNIFIYSFGVKQRKFSDYKHSEYVCVRSRDKQSLDNLVKQLYTMPFTSYTDIIDNQGSDYQFRMWVCRDTIALFVSTYLKNLNYGNFKNQSEDKYHSVFSKVWSVLWGLVTSRKPTSHYRQNQLFHDDWDLQYDDSEVINEDNLWDFDNKGDL